VDNCITMVNESAFHDNASQWEMWRKDKPAYQAWLNEKIADKATTARSHGFRYRGQYEEELERGERELGGSSLADGIPGENAEQKGIKVGVHSEHAVAVVTGVAEAPGA
jgi:hypothetical protein